MEITINCPELGELATAIKALAASTKPAAESKPAPEAKKAAKKSAEPQPAEAPVEQVYTMEHLVSAARKLVDEGKQIELQQLLQTYGAPSVVMIPKDRFGDFAAALRGMGAEL